MGMTIHYDLHLPATGGDPEQLLEQLRQFALDLQLARVGERVHHLVGDGCDYQRAGRESSHRWALIQARQKLFLDAEGHRIETLDGVRTLLDMTPLEIFYFSVWPGEGCEEANFGLARFPASIEQDGRRYQTGLDNSWTWTSFCKTQYASNIGQAHFLRCHLALIAILDRAAALGMLGEVEDNGGYFVSRDPKQLMAEVAYYNAVVAGVFQVADQVMVEQGLIGSSPVMDHPDYPGVPGSNRVANAITPQMLAELALLAKDELERYRERNPEELE